MGKNKKIKCMEHNTFSSGIIVGIILAIAVGGLAIYLVKRGSKLHPKNSSNYDTDNHSKTDNKDVISENNQEKDDKLNSIDSKNDANLLNKAKCNINVASISPYIKKFASSIGALLPVIKEGNEDGIGKLTFDNLDLVIHAIDSPELKSEWNIFSKDRLNWDDTLYKDKASSLIDLFKNAGVEIVYEHTIMWNDKSYLKYRKLSKVEEGDECEVLSPYALYNGVVIEQGLVKKLN